MIERDPMHDLHEQDKETIWKLRHECREHFPQSLPKVLTCVKWNNHIDVAVVSFCHWLLLNMTLAHYFINFFSFVLFHLLKSILVVAVVVVVAAVEEAVVVVFYYIGMPCVKLLVRERSALATLIFTLRVCLSVILSFCHSVCPQLRS